MVEPVVVRPDMASKAALVKVSFGSAISRGTVAHADTSTQPRVTSRKPSRGFSSRRNRMVAPASSNPVPEQTRPASRKVPASPSPMISEQAMGSM